jgi:hypothetical protein
VKERCFVLAQWEIMHVLQEFAESVHHSFQAAYSKDIEAVRRQGASFIKTADIDLSSNINPAWRYAIDAKLPQSANGEAGSNRQGGWKSWRDNDCDEIQRSDDNSVPRKLPPVNQLLMPSRCQKNKLTPILTNSTAVKQKPSPAIPASTPINLIESR